MNQQTLIFLGPQGSGKGTHATELEKDLKKLDAATPVVHFELGKQLREMAAAGSYSGARMGEFLGRGELAPYFIVEAVFGQYLTAQMRGSEHLIIDGLPRMPEQVSSLSSAMQFYSRETPTIIHINISDEIGLERLLKRGRADDTEENIRKRLSWSRKEWEKILALLNENPLYKVLEINGDQTIDEVHKEILQKLNLA